jgi:fatty aldehyde decarbonylase
VLAPDHPRYNALHRTIISHSMTGESIAIDHYAKMIPLARSIEERLELVEEAYHERTHLLSMSKVATDLGVTPVISDGYYWKKVREAFDKCVAAKDIEGCYVIQDIVLESYAIILYDALIPGLEPKIAKKVEQIAKDEREHLEVGIKRLTETMRTQAAQSIERLEFANEHVARVLAEWVQPSDCTPVCGVCGDLEGACAKSDLALINVDMNQVGADFAMLYGRTLRDVGCKPADVTRWLARLPIAATASA